jgi:hypothetical protein
VLKSYSAVAAALYRPYIKPHPSGDPLVDNFKFVALRRIKEASAAVASSIHGIMTQTRVEDIPVLMQVSHKASAGIY